MAIEKIYINTHRYDLFFTRICVSSVRYWYPGIPVSLIVDHSMGNFPSAIFLKKWSVNILDTNKRKYGWGFGKFEPLFLQQKEKFLILDADTAITGPVIEKLDNFQADFIVDKEVQPPAKLRSHYYDPEAVKKINSNFTYPGYTFNTGQWVGTSGILEKKDFDDVITWGTPPLPKYPAYFKQADQGILNFIIHLKEQQKEISVDKVPIMIWPDNGAADFINLNAIELRKDDYPFIIHWAGMKFKKLKDFPRHDIMQLYLNYYYAVMGEQKRIPDAMLAVYFKGEKKIRARMK